MFSLKQEDNSLSIWLAETRDNSNNKRNVFIVDDEVLHSTMVNNELDEVNIKTSLYFKYMSLGAF